MKDKRTNQYSITNAICDGDLGRNVSVERDIEDSLKKSEKLEPTLTVIVQQQQQQLVFRSINSRPPQLLNLSKEATTVETFDVRKRLFQVNIHANGTARKEL